MYTKIGDLAMQAETFLSQVEKIDLMIENKRAEVKKLKILAYGMNGSGVDKDRVMASGHDKISESVARYLDLERQIEADIDKLIATKQDVINVIEKLKANEYDLLYKVYIQYLTLGEVAIDKKKSYSWATTTHKRAKANVQKILDERNT